MLKILLLVLSVILIVISLLQSGKSDGLSAFTGSGDLGLFQNTKERGPEKVLSYITMGVGIAFFIVAILCSILK